MPSASRRTRPRRSRFAPLAALLMLLVLGGGVLLGVLAIPLAGVEGDAKLAKQALSQVPTALKAGDVPAAQAQLASARKALARAKKPAFGLAGDVWSKVPFAGSAARDLRRLVTALDKVTDAAAVAVEVYPEVTSKKFANSVVGPDKVDVARLAGLLEKVKPALADVRAARDQIEAVEADAPFVSDRIAGFRDQAAKAVFPVAASADRLGPAIDAVPHLFGADGEQRYLIALLNPAELRWAGGTPLSFVQLTADRGRLDFGETINGSDANILAMNRHRWEAVPGNPFHEPTLTRFQKAIFNPDWTVAGEELLRAFERDGSHYDGLIAIDVPAISSLMDQTGVIDVPGLGQVSGASLTKTLIGSYERFPDQSARREANKAVADVFKQRFLAGGRIQDKARALAAAGSQRHLAVYTRDKNTQAAVVAMGLSGRLAPTKQDYLGVFSRGTNASKADYWQQRTLRSRVRLAADGSAKVQLKVEMQNVAPPYAPVQYFPVDRGTGYFTRDLRARVLVVLPQGAKAKLPTAVPPPSKFASRGGVLGDGRRFLDVPVELPRQSKVSITSNYTVPRAAVLGDDTLTYRLAFDPQGMVTPQRLGVRLDIPAGYEISSLPAGWSATKSGAEYTVRATPEVSSWTIVLRKN